MIKRKRVISLLVICMLIISCPGSANAATTLPSISLKSVVLQDDSYGSKYNAMVNGIGKARPEDKARSLLQKKDPIDLYKIKQRSRSLGTRASFYYYPSTILNFVYYGQEYNNTCGAANLRMAIKMLTNTTLEESVIRDACMTGNTFYMWDMASYLNQKQSTNNYICMYDVSQATMEINLYSGIVYYDAPPIIAVKEVQLNGWPFNTGSHSLLVYGVNGDHSSFAVADPFGGYMNSVIKTYYASSDLLYNGYSLTDAGYMF